jgi:hypothetical protein
VSLSTTADSALVAPRAELLGNLVEIGHYTCGDVDDEFEAVVLRGADPLAVDAEESPAGCPRRSLVSIDERVVPLQGVHQRGGFEVHIPVRVPAEDPRAGARQS